MINNLKNENENYTKIEKVIKYIRFPLSLKAIIPNIIIPCGIRGKAVTSIEAELNRKVPIQEVKALILENFEKVFEAKLCNENQ